jgi:hypothetical protein|tara:strand:- start:182 stop:394 length:213 start_codon:yes stop_codon:yes gene_type:complete
VTKKNGFDFFPKMAWLSQKSRVFPGRSPANPAGTNPFRKKTHKEMEAMRPKEHARSFTGCFPTNHLFFLN